MIVIDRRLQKVGHGPMEYIDVFSNNSIGLLPSRLLRFVGQAERTLRRVNKVSFRHAAEGNMFGRTIATVHTSQRLSGADAGLAAWQARSGRNKGVQMYKMRRGWDKSHA